MTNESPNFDWDDEECRPEDLDYKLVFNELLDEVESLKVSILAVLRIIDPGNQRPSRQMESE